MVSPLLFIEPLYKRFYNDKKENDFFSYKKKFRWDMGSVAKSYMRKGFHEEMGKYLTISGLEAVGYI
jgi:hypothetical protein